MLAKRRAVKVGREADPYARPDVVDHLVARAKRQGTHFDVVLEAYQFTEYAKVPMRRANGGTSMQLLPLQDRVIWRQQLRLQPDQYPTLPTLLVALRRSLYEGAELYLAGGNDRHPGSDSAPPA